MDIARTPWLGTAAPAHATRTAGKLTGFAFRQLRHVTAPGPRACLDFGCGNGFITQHLAGHFDRVVGVDVEPRRLAEFRARVAGDPRFDVRDAGSEPGLPAEAFAMVTAFEVLEHVEDVEASATELMRVVAPGGVVVISAPQVLFPIETHGIQLGDRLIERKIPLLPWVPPLHRRLAIARVFSSRELDRIFGERGADLVDTGYAAPQFERAAADGARWESRLRFVRPLLDALEQVPGLRRLVGVSILKAFRKPR